jgi:hypothetical protein
MIYKFGGHSKATAAFKRPAHSRRVNHVAVLLNVAAFICRASGVGRDAQRRHSYFIFYEAKEWAFEINKANKGKN